MTQWLNYLKRFANFPLSTGFTAGHNFVMTIILQTSHNLDRVKIKATCR